LCGHLEDSSKLFSEGVEILWGFIISVNSSVGFPEDWKSVNENISCNWLEIFNWISSNISDL